MIATPPRVTGAGDRTRLTGLSGHIFQAPGRLPGCCRVHMDDVNSNDAVLWATTLARVRRELSELPAPDRDWLALQVGRIGDLQNELDRLFRSLDGPAVCAACLGECCSLARHHATLTNLLGYLLAGDEPPEPDYALTCPYLGADGCLMPVSRRPFTCVIFLCEDLDARLAGPSRSAYERVERELRATYEAIAARCPGASLRGLLISAARVGDRPLLTR